MENGPRAFACPLRYARVQAERRRDNLRGEDRMLDARDSGAGTSSDVWLFSVNKNGLQDINTGGIHGAGSGMVC